MNMHETTTSMIPMLRLWQLISPALPVGAYAYSQGLETAVEESWAADEASTYQWLHDVMIHSLRGLDVPIAIRLYRAFEKNDMQAIEYWNTYLYACRETRELRLEDNQLGQALAKLLSHQGVIAADEWVQRPDVTYLAMFSLAAVHWQIDEQDMLAGYLWAWCENQVAAAIKLVPLGQSAGQNILSAMMQIIPVVIEQGIQLQEQQIGSRAPGIALASARHETQYSRLFRS